MCVVERFLRVCEARYDNVAAATTVTHFGETARHPEGWPAESEQVAARIVCHTHSAALTLLRGAPLVRIGQEVATAAAIGEATSARARNLFSDTTAL